MEKQEKLFYSITEAMAAIGIKRTMIYSLINSGELKAVKVGRLTMIRSTDLQDFVDSRQPYAA
ncbi:helix-turn-helix domain-containing protein [Brucella intermedia]|uniref:helix-turn-helix domain-containing protein n=1 Tax=Brucella intermedia TaxID=94625 RepID=UPI00124C3D11|nr:helix-turn-helix domain-containing protein [Brucella intermedia]KAB2720951.1 helix-turn-helix domain-containing protein [Brucella intermedia]MBM7325673.1 helix-turn-helix domain-containing protein [Agrobacterium sp. S2]